MHQISHKPPHMTTDPLCYQLTHLTNIKRKKKFMHLQSRFTNVQYIKVHIFLGADYKTRNNRTQNNGKPTEHQISGGILTEHTNTDATPEHWQNNQNITEKPNKRTPA